MLCAGPYHGRNPGVWLSHEGRVPQPTLGGIRRTIPSGALRGVLAKTRVLERSPPSGRSSRELWSLRPGTNRKARTRCSSARVIGRNTRAPRIEREHEIGARGMECVSERICWHAAGTPRNF